MIKKVVRLVEGRVKMLQAMAAVIAMATAGYSWFVKPYIAREPVVVRPCQNLVVMDADSVQCDGVELRLIGDGEPGLTGIDAPEVLHAKCNRERLLGEAAATLMRRTVYHLKHVEDVGIVDNYQRPLVRLRLKDGTLAEHVLLKRGMAVIWTPSYVARWCELPGQGANKELRPDVG